MDTDPVGPEPGTCLECGFPTYLGATLCDACFSDFGEPTGRRDAAALPPAAAPAALRFADVVAELRELVHLASSADDGGPVVAAGKRAESLLESLRGQFLRDVASQDLARPPEPVSAADTVRSRFPPRSSRVHLEARARS